MQYQQIFDALKNDDIRIIVLHGSGGTGKTYAIKQAIEKYNEQIYKDVKYNSYHPIPERVTILVWNYGENPNGIQIGDQKEDDNPNVKLIIVRQNNDDLINMITNENNNVCVIGF